MSGYYPSKVTTGWGIYRKGSCLAIATTRADAVAVINRMNDRCVLRLAQSTCWRPIGVPRVPGRVAPFEWPDA